MWKMCVGNQQKWDTFVKGFFSHGGIEYDQSALAGAIAIYVPILDPDTEAAIGVMKVIVDLTAIKMDLKVSVHATSSASETEKISS